MLPLPCFAVMPAGPTERSTTVYVGKIAATLDDKAVREMLEACGPVKRCAACVQLFVCMLAVLQAVHSQGIRTACFITEGTKEPSGHGS